MASINTLVDNFDQGFVEGVTWTAAYPISTTPSEVIATAGTIVIKHSKDNTDYNALQTVTTYDFTGSSAHVQVADYGDQTIISHQVWFYATDSVSSNYITFIANNGTLSAYKSISGIATQIGASITLDTANHKWLRLRESGGTTFFDTAPDGTTWTNRWSVANPISVTSMYVVLQTGCYSVETKGSYTVFDNFNCGGKFAMFTDDFQSGINGAVWTTTGSADATKVTAENGHARVWHAGNVNILKTINNYDLTGCGVSIQLTSWGDITDALHDVRFKLIIDSNNWLDFYGHTSNLKAEKCVGGTTTTVGSQVAINFSTHRYLRIRENNGTTYWDTSPDGYVWNNLASAANPIAVTALAIQFECGGSFSSTNFACYDNVNVINPQYSYTPVRINNSKVGPMAMRRRVRQPVNIAPRRRTDDFFS